MQKVKVFIEIYSFSIKPSKFSKIEIFTLSDHINYGIGKLLQ